MKMKPTPEQLRNHHNIVENGDRDTYDVVTSLYVLSDAIPGLLDDIERLKVELRIFTDRHGADCKCDDDEACRLVRDYDTALAEIEELQAQRAELRAYIVESGATANDHGAAAAYAAVYQFIDDQDSPDDQS